MNVRQVVEAEFVSQLVSQFTNLVECIQSECIGGSPGCGDGGDAATFLEYAP